MRSRCNDVNHPAYARYGGRGIKVAPEFNSYEVFIAHIGHKPKARKPGERFTLERIDNNRGYEPGNVRWATYHEQQNNRSDCVLLELDGRTQTIAMWAREYGLPVSLVWQRIKRHGYDLRRALTTPADAYRKRGSKKSGK